jgi:hypothetical protein
MPVKDINKLLRLEFRFQQEADIERYGAGWHLYDENALIKLSARELMRLEGEIGAPLVDVLNGIRQDSVFGDTCAAFLALRLGGSDVKFADFEPAIMLTEWRLAAPVEPGKAPTPETDTPPAADSDTIVLQHAVTNGSSATPPAG